MPSFPLHAPPPPSAAAPTTLWTPEFILLFLLAMFANSYIAVFYSFEHWLAVQHISPHWRGVLLSALGTAVLLMRPVISVWLLRHRGLLLMGGAILANSAAMCGYMFTDGDPYKILALRLGQGMALGVFSSTVVAVLVDCIPKGQSARGFALFSLTMLLPYSIIPVIFEQLLHVLGGEARVYAFTSLLGAPAMIMLCLLGWRFRGRPREGGQSELRVRDLWQGLRTSGLGPLFWASGLFGATVVTVIFFIKGLAQRGGMSPGPFFMTYSSVIILVRLLLSARLDSLPRMPTLISSSVVLALVVASFALGPTWMLLPLAALYGLAVGLLYPMLAAAIYDGSSPHTRSLNSNIMMLTYDASNIAASLLGGFILDWGLGYTGVFCNGALLMLCSAGMSYLYARRS